MAAAGRNALQTTVAGRIAVLSRRLTHRRAANAAIKGKPPSPQCAFFVTAASPTA